jgi:hypothetical protein
VHILPPVAGSAGVSGSTTTPQLLPAAIEPAKASQATITMRYMPGVLKNSIIQKMESQQGKYKVVAQYEVLHAINVDERNIKLELVCRQVALDAPEPKE